MASRSAIPQHDSPGFTHVAPDVRVALSLRPLPPHTSNGDAGTLQPVHGAQLTKAPQAKRIRYITLSLTATLPASPLLQLPQSQHRPGWTPRDAQRPQNQRPHTDAAHTTHRTTPERAWVQTVGYGHPTTTPHRTTQRLTVAPATALPQNTNRSFATVAVQLLLVMPPAAPRPQQQQYNHRSAA